MMSHYPCGAPAALLLNRERTSIFSIQYTIQNESAVSQERTWKVNAKVSSPAHLASSSRDAIKWNA